MSANTSQIHSFSRVVPMIYAYTAPGVSYLDGWIKIGYTEKQTVEDRIKQQTHTSQMRTQLEWKSNAMYTDGSGEYFTDHDFHRFLEVQKRVERKSQTEWFKLDKTTSRNYFYDFASREIAVTETGETYTLREEQQKAVDMTKAYFESGGTEFLWNAKPRFGKTLSTYDLICKMGLKKVLIVTNRPAIANSWLDDFNKFIAWHGDYCFISDMDSFRDKPGVMTREEFSTVPTAINKGIVAFESLQGLKGSVYFGGDYRKLGWIAKEYTNGYGKKQHGLDFDLLIVDESQEGIETMRTEAAFRNISRKYTLYLSGTPFKQLANGQFNTNQIYNWSYADEQEAKTKWEGEEYNPYERLPKMSMFTYQLSNMIYDEIKKGADLTDDGDKVDYAFDLNEFFATNANGNFIHEDEVKKFLHSLSTQEKYPFSTPELRNELSHTLWLLNRVASAKALAKMLADDPVFSEYEIVIAAGDGKVNEEDTTEAAFDRVKTAIATHDKTITLSVGQLTVGVTIPEWSGVLMLCNLNSPSSYMQAAFRAQNPCVFTVNGQRFRKETAYVFDFDPARTLVVFDDFANNLSPDTAAGKGTTDSRKDNIRRLLNFFPVLGEDKEGKMVELDAAQVLSIPRKIKSQEVVRHGFMSNFLFQNISNVFGCPDIVKEIIGKLTPAQEETRKKEDALDGIDKIDVDEEGNINISQDIVIGKTQDLFGDKIYEELSPSIEEQFSSMTDSINEHGFNSPEMDKEFKKFKEVVKQTVTQHIIEPAAEDYGVSNRAKNTIQRQSDNEIDKTLDELHNELIQLGNTAKAEFEQCRKEAETPEEIHAAEQSYQETIATAMNDFMQAAQEKAQETLNNRPDEVVEKMERLKKEDEKKTVEDSVRDHLRGFSRTIPSFIMAYGDENLTLSNFDDYTEDDVFIEVTGITEDDFRFLRDGGPYTDPETGEEKHFNGHLFDEVVFDDSIQEFLHKKTELVNYFDETHDEDIFDYIPPQKTNQIFTPRWVVTKMVDELEENNPGCFDNPDNTFADLYMKSGLYITEIVKRLYRSERMKELYPDNKDRIQHILQKQVYGMAPTRIIYLIATNYILGFNDKLKSETCHFVQADATEAAKENNLDKLVNEKFGQ